MVLLLNALALGIAIMSLIVWYKSGDEAKFDCSIKYFDQPPAGYPPAVAGYLCRLEVNVNDIFATLLDLTDRGHLTIKTQADKSGINGNTLFKRTKGGKDELAPFENNLLDYIFNKISLDGVVSFKNIHNRIQNYSYDFKDFFENWKTLVLVEEYQYGLIGRLQENKIYLAVVYLCLAIGFLLFFAGAYLGLITIGVSVFLISKKTKFKRRTFKGAQDYAKWEAFKTFLCDYSNLEEAGPSDLILWNHFLSYAVALGVAKEITKQYGVSLSELENEQRKASMFGGLNLFNT